MQQQEATRQILWNIDHSWVMYLLLVPTVIIGAYGIYRRVSLWRLGQPAARFDRPLARARRLFEHAAAQRRTARNAFAGIFHRLITYGFIVLLIATTVVALDYDFGTTIMRGSFYLYFQSFTVDVFGALVMVGVGMAAVRRLISKPAKLVYSSEATCILVVIFVLCLQGFLLEGWRIAATKDVWGVWSPIGYIFAQMSAATMSESAMIVAHKFFWWFHLVSVYGFLAWVPYTKMMHIITAPLNIYTASLVPIGGTLKPIDFDKAEKFGVNSLADFTWKDLLDLDSCTECGRCTEVCPANTVGKSLSPRDIILDLQGMMRGAEASDNAQSAARNTQFVLPIIKQGLATAPENLWQCTTCAACVEACPVFIDQMPKIVDMRRFLVMEEAEFPQTMQDAIGSLESRGHPFRGTQFTRLDWMGDLDIPQMTDVKDAEVLFWVGCGGALIERNQKVTRATAELLKEAGVKFAILGREEKCTGDVARRIGNEFLFESLATENIAKLNDYNVKTIVTSCPHCFNTFRNEYPHLGGTYEVFHHSEFLNRLVEQGRLKPMKQTDKSITFHDPCYLGRQNDVFDAPRALVQISSNRKPVEMARSREKSFCCGGGGGMSFVDEPADKRVNQERAREILETGADTVAVGCPFCMTMLEDGINAKKGDRDIRVMDVSEILLEAVKG